MKGYVSHLITENEKLEQELTADYDAALHRCHISNCWLCS